jgi:hypothetical protein
MFEVADFVRDKDVDMRKVTSPPTKELTPPKIADTVLNAVRSLKARPDHGVTNADHNVA